MISRFKMGDKPTAQLISNPTLLETFRFGGVFGMEHIREGKVIHEESFHNVFTDEGLNHMLNVLFANASQEDSWYICTFQDNVTPVGGDTYVSKGFTETNTGIDETYRPTYTDVVSSKTVTNSASKATFTYNTTLTIYGAAILGYPGTDSSNYGRTKGNNNAGGVYLCGGKFAASRAVVDDDVINVTYAMTSADT